MDYQKNYYEILGVPKNADENAIKSAYKKLALKYHPDRNKEDSAENIFKSVNEANQILSDPNTRKDYDLKSPHGQSYNPFAGGFGFGAGFGGFGSDIFEIFNNFGFNMGGSFTHRRQDFVEQLDIAMNINISLIDIYNNREIRIKYNKLVPCPDCDFTGFDKNSEEFTCEMCGGVGKDQYGRMCEYCRGKGKIHTGNCPTCNGEKVISREQEISLRNAHTIRSNKTEYLAGFGHHSRYYRGKVGILQLNITFQNDLRYEIRDNNLYFKLNLHFQDAIDGIKHNHKHLDDKTLKINIPAKTKDKDLIRIPKKGLYINDTERADLIFDINIIIDYNKL